jgi:uncharacterized membrane protein YphA (DoxX/SURF4 family)
MSANRTGLALLILRVGLGFFLLLWSIDKLVAPENTVRIFERFYFIPINATLAQVTGLAELLLSVCIILGFRKTISYGLGMALHAVSTISTYDQLLSPFGKNHLFIAGLPVLAAFVTLFLLRKQDRVLSVDA